jgi:UDP-N-acetylmuramoyl-tripeptide--D-alanyl-D-alanine ligase
MNIDHTNLADFDFSFDTTLYTLVQALPQAERVAGFNVNLDLHITGIATDSRKVQPGDLFIALRGERYDAHDFLPQVAALGAVAVVAEKVPEEWALPTLLVPDSQVALGQLAAYWRAQFQLPLIAVTGSNGKTTVKEMLAAILATVYGEAGRCATRGNFNNAIGLPLTLLRLRPEHQAAVIEMGMNHPGEIASLANLARPTVTLVNNAQREHQEFMQNVEAVAQENGNVISSLPENGVAVFPADDEFTPLWYQLARQAKARTITFGLSDVADISCQYRVTEYGSDLRVALRSNQSVRMQPLKLRVAGEHNVRNALAAIACSMALGLDILAVARALEAFRPVGGRLQTKKLANGVKMIDDTYNANPDSVRAAILVLAQATTPRVLVLGDMGEVGDQGAEFHSEAGHFARQQGIETVFCLGPLSKNTQQAFGKGAQHFAHLEDLLEALEQNLHPRATILVKGSRFMRMERVVAHFVPTDPLKEEH